MIMSELHILSRCPEANPEKTPCMNFVLVMRASCAFLWNIGRRFILLLACGLMALHAREHDHTGSYINSLDGDPGVENGWFIAAKDDLPTSEMISRLPMAMIAEAAPGGDDHLLAFETRTRHSVIETDSLSIKEGETVRLTQPDSLSTAIIRVTGNAPAVIAGKLVSNGKVVLLSPGGIEITASGEIESGGFVASTLEPLDGGFSTDHSITLRGSSEAGLSNAGKCSALSGDIILIGRALSNKGGIETKHGNVVMAAGSEVTLGKDADDCVFVRIPTESKEGDIEQTGVIKAACQIWRELGGNDEFIGERAEGSAMRMPENRTHGRVEIHAGTGRARVSGSIGAGCQEAGGAIAVSGREVIVESGANIDASGDYTAGSIKIGGGYQGKDDSIANSQITRVMEGAMVKADCRNYGNGGTVIVWSDVSSTFQGLISAKGGALAGNGGFVEVSGKQWLDFKGVVDLAAPKGEKGKLLLDPTNLRIQAASPNLDGNGATGDDIAGDIASGDFAGANSIITSGQLGTLLDSANVSLAATNDITVAAPISWSIPFGLTLTAGNEILVNSPISGGGGTMFNAPSIKLGANISTGGSQTYNGAVTLTGNSILTGTDLFLTSGLTGAGNHLTLDFSTAFTLAGGISGVNNFTAQKAVNVSGAFTTTGRQTYNGAVTLTGNSILTGTNLILASGLTGGGNHLTLDFSTAFTLAGGISGVNNFTAQKAVNVSGAFTTTGSQTYNGAVTPSAGSTLSASAVNFNNSLQINGAGVGRLNVTGATVFGAGSSFVAQVSGAGTANHDRLVATGAVTITNGATMSVNSIGGYVWNGADSFTMIENDGSDAIVGTFSGPTLANFLGSTFTAARSYTGGTGNDLVFAAPLVNLSINDVTSNEGNAGTANFTFTVSLSSPAPDGGITFDIATADGTASTTNSDYVAKTLTSQTIPAGSSTYEFVVMVNGDTVRESNETFFVNVTNVSGTGSVVTDGQGLGTIVNDDAEADLAVTVTDGAVSEVPGTSVTYTIVASNSGPDPVTGATLTNSFPAAISGISWTAVGSGGGTIAASGTGNINELISLPVGGSVTVTATGSISPSATGSLSNTATVAMPSGISDPTPANNSATDTDTLTPQADLAITKTNGVTTVTPGGSTIYTITVSNAGPSNAVGVTVADTLPAALTATWTGVGSDGGTGPTSGSGNINTSSVSLPVGASFTFTVSADIAASATGNLSNTATITPPGSVTDSTPANNSATDTDTLTPQADLAITKTNGVDTSMAGGTTTYTITVTNNGPSDAPVSSVVDTLPASISGATWVSSAAGGATATASGTGNLNDTISLPVAGSVIYTITAPISVSATGTLTNTATVSSSATDPTPANNSDTDTDTLVSQADLVVQVSGSPVTAQEGSEISYTLTLTNLGTSDASNPSISFPLPSELSFVSAASPAGWVSTAPAIGSGGTISFSNVGIGNGVVASFTVVTMVRPGTATGTQVTATASASAGNPDPVAGNNVDSATSAVGTLNPTAVQLATSATLDRQNGMYGLTVNVTNTTPLAISGFRLRVDFATYLANHPSLRLYNATTGPGSSDVYVDYPYPVATDAVVPVKLMFYTSTRTFPSPFTPVFDVEILPVSAVAGTDGSGVEPRIVMMPNSQVLLEFPSVPGRWYRVRYSHDLTKWFESAVPIQASNNRMQWIDSGAPFTSSEPASVPSRYYRVNEIPVTPTP